MTVLVPADASETRAMTRAIARYHGPVYMRLTRNDMPGLPAENLPFEIGQPRRLRDGRDVAVFACGLMVWRALEAAECLAQKGLSVRVVNVSSLKPVDEAALRAEARGMKGLVTAEEHSLIGGLGSLIADVLQGSAIPLQRIGIADQFGQSAHSFDDLANLYGLTSQRIQAAIEQVAGV
jgi:transketolase